MLRIYVCSQCGATRIVSNNHDSSCLSCNKPMSRAPISYEEYIHLDNKQREIFVANYLNKIVGE
jgi:hypothetical protein